MQLRSFIIYFLITVAFKFTLNLTGNGCVIFDVFNVETQEELQ